MTLDPNFDTAVAILIDEEGGYVNNPADPGKETKYGISKRSYPNEDIPNLTVDRAKTIYFKDYWLPLEPYALPPRMKRLAFECAVNQGVGRVKGFLDSVKGQPESIAISWFQTERALYYFALPTFKVFGKGWIRRLFKETLDV